MALMAALAREPHLPSGKAVVNVVLREYGLFTKSFRLGAKVWRFTGTGHPTLEFVSANPTVIKSIKQRDLLNTWLRLFAPAQRLPRLVEFQPDRIEDELPDLVFMTIEKVEPLLIVIDSDGTRMSTAYGYTGRGRYLDEYLGPRLAPQVMPIYRQCVTRALPTYSIAHVDDARGRIVAYERMLLPFSETGSGVTHIIASLKTISEDGSFEIINLMRGNDNLPTQKLRAVIDRGLIHRLPGRIPSAEQIEFS
jgi:hypothetical protein